MASWVQKPKQKDRHDPSYTAKYQKETYDAINLRFRKDSGILEGMRIMAHRKGVTVSEYARQAIENQLGYDGYIPGE